MSTFSIKGADGAIEVAAGEYYFNTKARARRMMLNSLSLEARQIYACLELATMGFQQELAVTMANAKKILLTNAHIQDQTGLSKQNVRRGLAELEAAGLVERRGIAGGPLHKGKVEIYCWAEPREPKPKRESRPTTIPVWFPTSWEPFKPLIRRFKLQLLPDLGVQRDSVLAEGEELALRLQNTEKVVVSFLNGVCAAAPLYKEERTERTIEINQSSGERANPVECRAVEEDPPARLQDDLIEVPKPTPKPPEMGGVPEPEWQTKLREFLATRSIPTHLDEDMFRSIAGQLSEDLLEQFQTAAKEAKSIRKWSGYLAIAKQVEARGVVKPPGENGAGESWLERKHREIVERREKEEKARHAQP